MPEKIIALRLAVYYRLVATVSFLVGGAIVLVGLWLGMADAIGVLFSEFLEPDMVSETLAAGNPLVTIVFVFVGATVWQVGKAAALHWTLATAIEADAPTDREAAPAPRASGEPGADRTTADDGGPERDPPAGGDDGGTSERTTGGDSSRPEA